MGWKTMTPVPRINGGERVTVSIGARGQGRAIPVVLVGISAALAKRLGWAGQAFAAAWGEGPDARRLRLEPAALGNFTPRALMKGGLVFTLPRDSGMGEGPCRKRICTVTEADGALIVTMPADLYDDEPAAPLRPPAAKPPEAAGPAAAAHDGRALRGRGAAARSRPPGESRPVDHRLRQVTA